MECWGARQYMARRPGHVWPGRPAIYGLSIWLFPKMLMSNLILFFHRVSIFGGGMVFSKNHRNQGHPVRPSRRTIPARDPGKPSRHLLIKQSHHHKQDSLHWKNFDVSGQLNLRRRCRRRCSRRLNIVQRGMDWVWIFNV